MKPEYTHPEVLTLLERELPVVDGKNCYDIYDHLYLVFNRERGLRNLGRFAEEGALQSDDAATIEEFTLPLRSMFGPENVVVKVADDAKTADAEITMHRGGQPVQRVFTVRIDATIANGGEPELKVPFVPFPFALPDDPEMVWSLARREDLGVDEAKRLLTELEAEFWETRKGLNLQKKRVERTFANFIEHVPTAALRDLGLKRHYKTAEPVAVKTTGATAKDADSSTAKDAKDAKGSGHFEVQEALDALKVYSDGDGSSTAEGAESAEG